MQDKVTTHAQNITYQTWRPYIQGRQHHRNKRGRRHLSGAERKGEVESTVNGDEEANCDWSTESKTEELDCK